jgi:hypothetical protein
VRKRVQSVVQARDRPGDKVALSIGPLLVLYWSSTGPLLIALCFPSLSGGFLAGLRRFRRARAWIRQHCRVDYSNEVAFPL